MPARFVILPTVAVLTSFALVLPGFAAEDSGSFQPTPSVQAGGPQDPHLPGSGSMHEADRTGATAPSGSTTSSPEAGAVNTTARVAKPAGDSAVTDNDRALAARIRVSLEGDPSLVRVSEDSLHIRVDNGQVTLQGQVTTPALKTQIGQHVTDIPGVQSLDNQLQVASKMDADTN